MGVDIEAVLVSSKPMTIRQMIAVADLKRMDRKARAAFILFSERTDLDDDVIMELTGAEASRLLHRLGDGLVQASALRKMSASFEDGQ